MAWFVHYNTRQALKLRPAVALKRRLLTVTFDQEKCYTY